MIQIKTLPLDCRYHPTNWRLYWRRHMRNIVDEAGEIIAKATDDHTLIGGHHRLALAASLGQKLFWQDTGEPVKLDPFFRGKFSSTYSLMRRQRARLAERLVKAHHVDAAEFIHLMTVGGSSATPPHAPGAPPCSVGSSTCVNGQ
jgi:hypothetical protein